MPAPPSRIATLIEDRWTDIEAAVAKGLTDNAVPALRTVVPLIAPGTNTAWGHGALVIHDVRVDVETFADLDASTFTSVAIGARRKQWGRVVSALLMASAGTPAIPYRQQLALTSNDLAGTGVPRLLLFNTSADTARALEAAGLIGSHLVLADGVSGRIPPGVCGLALRPHGGPYVVAEELRLGWDVEGRGARIVVAGRVQVRQVGPATAGSPPGVVRLAP